MTETKGCPSNVTPSFKFHQTCTIIASCNLYMNYLKQEWPLTLDSGSVWIILLITSNLSFQRYHDVPYMLFRLTVLSVCYLKMTKPHLYIVGTYTLWGYVKRNKAGLIVPVWTWAMHPKILGGGLLVEYEMKIFTMMRQPSIEPPFISKYINAKDKTVSHGAKIAMRQTSHVCVF